eukprot:11190187-Lingulodinium_polyedra.AAC.4
MGSPIDLHLAVTETIGMAPAWGFREAQMGISYTLWTRQLELSIDAFVRYVKKGMQEEGRTILVLFCPPQWEPAPGPDHWAAEKEPEPEFI